MCGGDVASCQSTLTTCCDCSRRLTDACRPDVSLWTLTHSSVSFTSSTSVESRCTRSSASYVRSPVEDQVRWGQWVIFTGSGVFFSALTLLVGWQEGHLACSNNCTNNCPQRFFSETFGGRKPVRQPVSQVCLEDGQWNGARGIIYREFILLFIFRQSLVVWSIVRSPLGARVNGFFCMVYGTLWQSLCLPFLSYTFASLH